MSGIRRPFLAGNWKMNLGPSEARDFMARFLELWPAREDRTVAFFPPALSFAAAREAAAARPDLGLGVQNVHAERSGAFTGEVSAPMAADAGARFVLVGHSERRHVFGESVADTVRKTRAVLSAGLAPVVCVGEKLDERQAGRAEAVVDEQLGPVMAEVQDDEAARLVLAYEPVWAIGTGVTATPQDAGAMHRFIRRRLVERFGQAGARIPVLYGGSVKAENAAELLAQEGVDGVLVGGASLDPAGFAAICAAAG
jgi:triosephosphate isomerase (TIM)